MTDSATTDPATTTGTGTAAVGVPGRPVPHPPRLARRSTRDRIAPLGMRLLLWGYAVVALMPLAIMVLNSFRPSQALYDNPLGLPLSPTLDNYVRAWSEASFSRYFVNSTVVTVAAVALGTGVSALAAYPLGRYAFRGSGLLIAYFLAGLMLPIRWNAVPIFYLLSSLNMIDSHLGLILVYAASGVPFSIFVLTAFFRQLPPDLEEAARMDGAGEVRIFGRIMLPMVRPALATVSLFQFVQLWNDFFFPLILLRSTEKYTLPVGLSTFFGQYQTDYALLFAGLVIATIPLVLVFLLATRQIVSGLTAGMSR